MNRIIIVGNGFDLAHGLKTSYNDFVYWYWYKRLCRLENCQDSTSKDSLCSIELLKDGDYVSWAMFYAMACKCLYTNVAIKRTLYSMTQNKSSFKFTKSQLFDNISRNIDQKGWVDIENEYYILLKSLLSDHSKYRSPKDLNSELESLKVLLFEYLNCPNGCFIEVNEKLKDQMLASIKEDEIAVSNKKQFSDFALSRFDIPSKEWMNIFKEYGFDEKTIKIIRMNMHHLKDDKKEAVEKGIFRTILQKGLLGILIPERIMLLNFNYTTVADRYLPNNEKFAINHIHGSINDIEGMIFGYGDELDNDYRRIQEINDNEYLKNIKSVRYLESSNYRNMLSFTEAGPFQIYIMGHSCGNSDRTLLNTLFEHKNCVSIKPFYYEKRDENGNEVSDNYMEIVQNISRNFTDMKLFRDRVVNKEYCESLSQVKKQW